jgi:hypothetical protein
LKQQPLDPGAGARKHASLVGHTASTHPQHDRSGPRPAARAVVLLAATACCAALLSAVTADSATAGSISTPGYLTTMNATDAMNRTVAGGFGTAPTGGSWGTLPSSKFSVSSGTGHISAISPGQSVRATLTAAHPPDEQIQSTFNLPTLPTAGNGIYYNLEFRRQSTPNAYRVQLRVGPGGTMTLGFSHLRNNVATPVGSQVVVPQRITAGHTIVLQGLVAGSSTVLMRARAWYQGTSAPGWQLAASDSSPTRLTALGRIGVYVMNHATSRATRVTVDGFTGWRLTPDGSPPPPPPPPPPGGKPGAANTGVPTGTHLTQHVGDITVTVAGTHIDAMDLHGFLTIKAANVTVTRSIIRGGVATSGNVGLVTDTDARGTGFKVSDSTFVPVHPSVYIDGIKGWNYTLTRVEIYGTVDTAKVYGNNTTIQNSWLHGTVYYAHDPNQGGEHTHNDGVQVLSGTNIRIINNTITGAYNAAIQVTQGHGAVSNLWFNGNWADGGGCSVNVNNSPMGTMQSVSVNSNRFGHATRNANCPIIVTHAISLTATHNVYDDTGAVAAVRYG